MNLIFQIIVGLVASCLLFVPTAYAQTPSPASPTPLKIAYVYVSPIGEAGWTHQHDQARKAVEKHFGSRVSVSTVASVAEGADAERVIRDLANQGNRLIFTTSFGYMNATEKVAAEFPDTVFMHATGYKTAPNMGNYNARFYEGRYLTGVLAGRMSRSGVIGYVAAFPIPEVLQGINAFTLGLRSVNPKAMVKVIWTASWYDPGREKEAAQSLINQGADVLTHHTDSTAVVQTAEAAGLMSIGYHSDMSKFAPKGFLSAATHHWAQHNISVVDQVLKKTWKPTAVWGSAKDGFVDLAPFGPAVPKKVQDEVRQLKANLLSGKLHPFAGPVVDQDGAVKVPAGQVMSDKDLAAMKFYVMGVDGKLPAKN